MKNENIIFKFHKLPNSESIAQQLILLIPTEYTYVLHQNIFHIYLNI